MQGGNAARFSIGFIFRRMKLFRKNQRRLLMRQAPFQFVEKVSRKKK